MKVISKLSLVVMGFLFSTLTAQATQGFIDLVPMNLVTKRVPGGGGGVVQNVTIYIKNVGNMSLQTHRRMLVEINEQTFASPIYAHERLGGQLGGPIRGGEVGRVMFTTSLNTFRHCQKVRVKIDVGSTKLQVEGNQGEAVFDNDLRFLIVRELGNQTACPSN